MWSWYPIFAECAPVTYASDPRQLLSISSALNRIEVMYIGLGPR
jgi:hypothetical protein